MLAEISKKNVQHDYLIFEPSTIIEKLKTRNSNKTLLKFARFVSQLIFYNGKTEMRFGKNIESF